jgi:peptidoglycan/LPS O-acetylase OafA/YrhL
MQPGQPLNIFHKPHYPILDGLRGTAAVLVVMFHLLEAYFPVYKNLPIHHGYLAVDFFFLLSGFVVGYAYDDRWPKMSLKEFFKIRLIRLQPLVVLGAIIGAIGFYFDPYTNGMQQVGFLKLMLVMFLGAAMLPAPDLRGWNETHSLNGPCWSLLQEYIANIMYALFGRKMTKPVLWIIVILSAAALTAFAVWHKDVASGWAYDQFWHAATRMMFPFFAGLLLFRTGKLIKIPMAYLLCSLLLILIFCLPVLQYNGLYEAAVIIFVFPLIVAAGAGSNISGRWAKLCRFAGDISYPIYILHYPFIYIYTAWVAIKKPAADVVIPVAIGLFVFLIVLAYAALKLFDEPVRAWLKKKYLSQKNS